MRARSTSAEAAAVFYRAAGALYEQCGDWMLACRARQKADPSYAGSTARAAEPGEAAMFLPIALATGVWLATMGAAPVVVCGLITRAKRQRAAMRPRLAWK